jgi:hypothetical protein
MNQTYKIEYKTTCDYYNQSHFDCIFVEASSSDDANDKAQYQLDKQFPNGNNTIIDIDVAY